MCGIAGIMIKEPVSPELETLSAMTMLLRHRGPDDAAIWRDAHIGLGFRRLAIVDPEGGRQPLASEDGRFICVFNGEIYNYRPLRAELEGRGHRFCTDSDGEVIVHLYEERGADCVQELEGMFAFVIWDRAEQRLFGARDRFGIKPLYYAAGREQLSFASEIKSLTGSGVVAPAVRPASLLAYLTFQYVPDPDTMFEGVRKLPSGHIFTARPGEPPCVERYWQPLLAPEPAYRGEACARDICQALEHAVASHLTGDAEIGCLLSSGIDSTAIAAAMRRHGPVRTYSVGFAGPADETGPAARTAALLGTTHTSEVISREAYFAALPHVVAQLDEPLADPSAVALYEVTRLAARDVKVVLSGEGADELFGGYRIYREPQALAPLAALPGPLRRLLHAAAQRLPAGLYGRGYVLRGTTPLEARFVGNAKIFSEEMKAQLLEEAWRAPDGYVSPQALAARLYDRNAHLDPAARMQDIDLNLWLPGDILMKADKMSMAHALELRVPYLSSVLYEVARRLPPQERVGGGTTKTALRRALAGLVPEEVRMRPKLGFPVPLRRWLAELPPGELLGRIEAGRIGGYIRLPQVERLLREHRDGDADHARKLWTVLCFAMWHGACVHKTAAPCSAAPATLSRVVSSI
ncbi:asparagine synthase (glutamine-hydrolyzing) [Paenibacillus sp. IB182496]|uniref:asparagine synthase (glutamine-hydrolyzing) n=1 Tax=Paenibacillus sabuli TaxID=2772509 RepID=A0A927BTC7_9BACL|nr:asparagine synthase (glutamine-hydrolyzing) [Paenibacillus sabuli]MBD2845063.1 asparagine synthase (glutamine-hydrolyzing) [Paenibacillus sabuli]